MSYREMINYLKGDATEPITKNTINIIVHICNNLGGWGAGFVLALSKKWKLPERKYRELFRNNNSSRDLLGYTQLVKIDNFLYVANMIAQNEYYSEYNPIPLDYNALDLCLESLNLKLKEFDTEVNIHMPRIGCGLAGGKWENVEKIIINRIGHFPIYVYDYEILK